MALCDVTNGTMIAGLAVVLALPLDAALSTKDVRPNKHQYSRTETKTFLEETANGGLNNLVLFLH